MAYYSLEPWGEERADWRNGLLCATTVNLWAGKDDRKARPQDFVPDFTGREKETAAKEMGLQESIQWARELAGGRRKDEATERGTLS